MTTSTQTLTPEAALTWLQRWDAQQATYFTDREERFEVICDVVEHVLDRPDPLIVDLGVGPGSLATRLLQRLPGARVVGADMDPLLLGLAERAYGGDRFRTVRVDLRTDGWLDALELDRAPDAFVSTTALHWLDRPALMRLLTTASSALVPGGVVVDGDHLYDGARSLDELTRVLADRAADRAGRVEGEDWRAWWDAVPAAPELAALRDARARVDLAHDVHDLPSTADYLQAMRDGGCSQVGQVWQVGDDRVVVGLR
ncbi:class I SAM-dependent methyltransferase [Luteipulveratus halotolerans]|uniref:Methyltransferase type 12 n=1 Tax=Luteipulveratus halotolerans TaxID=1631356 RepID=A0A0L6CGF9_9MICO|nr:class I SAM-dependent methyltransferase [Luteipulveratus halotolerans]KNX36804.1 methyltransferase type 12 [Luteipulveratus halotolerans]